MRRETEMTRAFVKAGYRSPEQRLAEMARDALKGAGSDFEAAVGLFIDALPERALYQALAGPEIERAVRRFLRSEARETGGHYRTDNLGKAAPRPVLPNIHGGGCRSDDAVTPEDRSRPLPRQPSRDGAAILQVAAVKARSILDTFIVNGQPLGRVSVREARAWARSRRRDARFIDLVTANLPMDAAIGDFRSPEDAAGLYAQAQRETEI